MRAWGVWGWGLRVQGVGFRVWGFGIKAEGMEIGEEKVFARIRRKW